MRSFLHPPGEGSGRLRRPNRDGGGAIRLVQRLELANFAPPIPCPARDCSEKHPLERAQVSSPAILLPVPSRGRAQGLAILLRRGCVERGGRGLVSGQPWRAPKPASLGRLGAAPGGSGAVSPIAQRVWRRESDRSGDGSARGPPSRRGRGSGKGLRAPLVRETEPYSSWKTTYAERLSFAETVFSIFFRAGARTLRRPFPSLQRVIA